MKKALPLLGIVIALIIGFGLLTQSSNQSKILKREKTESNQSMSNTNHAVDTSKKFIKPTMDELKQKLTDIQFQVTQKDATERPYTNPYNDEKRQGIYVDVVSGEPLFSSNEKFDSGTGWPSFYNPLETENVVVKTDYKLLFPRKEVRSVNADSHLGHVFNDGPAPTGLRYCLNSAALRFIPKEQLAEAGYAQYTELFSE